MKKGLADLEWWRGKRSNTQISERMIWRSKVGNYEVQQCKSYYEKDDDGKRVTYFYALRSNRILKRQRTKNAAVKTCNKDYKKRNV